MSSGIGQLALFGITPGGTWHTAVSLPALSLVKTTETPELSDGQEDVQDESQHGTYYCKYVDKGQEIVDVEFSGQLRYENAHWFHIAQWIGTDSGSGTAAPYTHAITFVDEPTGFYTAAGLIDDMVIEWPSIKPVGWEITTGDDGVMYFSASGIGDHVAYGTDAVNTSTSVGTTATFDTEVLQVLIGHARIRMNAQAGTALDAGDDITDKCKITISCNRPYDRQFLAGGTGTANEWKTSEPQQNGLLNDITLTLDFEELESLTYLTDHQSASAKKCEIVFVKTSSNFIRFEFPNLRPLKPSSKVSGPGRIPQTIVYQCLSAAAAPTGMAVTDPFKLSINNGFAANYLNGTAI